MYTNKFQMCATDYLLQKHKFTHHVQESCKAQIQRFLLSRFVLWHYTWTPFCMPCLNLWKNSSNEETIFESRALEIHGNNFTGQSDFTLYLRQQCTASPCNSFILLSTTVNNTLKNCIDTARLCNGFTYFILQLKKYPERKSEGNLK